MKMKEQGKTGEDVDSVAGIGGGGRNEGSLNNDHQSHYQAKQEGIGGVGEGSSSLSSSSTKAKSCKGCLYYSSILKSKSRNPVCVGFTRSLPQLPRYVVGESEVEASKEGRSLTDFKYACVGYSVYTDRKDQPASGQEVHSELPVCVGMELLVDRRPTNANSAPAHAYNREDGHGQPQTRSHKPAHAVGDEFLNRFTRNASLVASGVAKNLRRVGNHLKEAVDALYSYGKRPK